MESNEPSTSEVTTPEEKPKVRRKSGYNLAFKKEVILHALVTNISATARKFNIPRSCIQNWIRHKDAIMNVDNDEAKRLKGAGRKIRDQDFEDSVISWIKEQNEKKIPLSRRIIQNKAREISKDPKFTASNGWIESFMARHKILFVSEDQSVPQEPLGNLLSVLMFQEFGIRLDGVEVADEEDDSGGS